jgi:hypothetical protein
MNDKPENILNQLAQMVEDALQKVTDARREVDDCKETLRLVRLKWHGKAGAKGLLIFDDEFRSLVPAAVVTALDDAGFLSVEQVRTATNKELLALDGIGRARLKSLRAVIRAL